MLPPMSFSHSAINHAKGQGSRPTAGKNVLRLRLCPRAAPGVLLSAASGCGITWKYMERGVSPLIASAFVAASSLLRTLGVRSRGGRGRKAASSLRLHHLAPE
ncbi:hypothetical protein NDU88_004276 [Pleurodeles waltl]|uniref:Uncharacterized protein n=1 Tax=Pleurodeles waltl TaxID=8319 RepID=A0AAV7W4K3_PLEWA|nr:hypothetical protein NDU88_004276 [Pleurodeles waltl]